MSIRIASSISYISIFIAFFFLSQPVWSIKFEVPASRYPTPKCIWNNAHSHSLVVVTANVGPGDNQRVDVEVVDSSEHKNVYLNKKDIKGETRLAITTHTDGDVGVCFKNYADTNIASSQISKMSRVVDLDVDIGAEAIDYNAIANQESLSALETEMRKLEGVVKEIMDEMTYLKKREQRFRDTNESTRSRVQTFALFTLICLIALGVWQVFHLRAFFKRKYLID